MLKQFYTTNISLIDEKPILDNNLIYSKQLLRKNINLPSFINFYLVEKVNEFDKSKINQEQFLKLSLFNSIAKRLIKSGKSQRARTILNNVLAGLKKKGFNKPLKLINDSLVFLKPIFNILNVKKGRKTIAIPFFLSEQIEIGVIIKWIVMSASKRLEKGFENKLIAEIVEIYQQKGLLFQKKNDLIKQIRDSVKNLRLLRAKTRRRKFFSIPK